MKKRINVENTFSWSNERIIIIERGKKPKTDDDVRVFNSKWCTKFIVVPHNQGVCQITVSEMKEYNIKRHYTTKHHLIILSCHGHRYPWPFLATSPNRSRFQQVLRDISRILTELLYVGSSWSPCFCHVKGSITYELVPTSPAVSCMSGSSNLNSFRDGW